jgi:hypothetical protein
MRGSVASRQRLRQALEADRTAHQIHVASCPGCASLEERTMKRCPFGGVFWHQIMVILTALHALQQPCGAGTTCLLCTSPLSDLYPCVRDALRRFGAFERQEVLYA